MQTCRSLIYPRQSDNALCQLPVVAGGCVSAHLSNNLIVICISQCFYSVTLFCSLHPDRLFRFQCVLLLNAVMVKLFHSGHREMTSVFRVAVTVNISEKWLPLSVCKSDGAFVAGQSSLACVCGQLETFLPFSKHLIINWCFGSGIVLDVKTGDQRSHAEASFGVTRQTRSANLISPQSLWASTEWLTCPDRCLHMIYSSVTPPIKKPSPGFGLQH